MVMVVYPRDKVNDQELDNKENQFKVLVGVLRGSVKLRVRRSTHGQLPNFKNKEAIGVEQAKQANEENTTPAGDSGGTTAAADLGGMVDRPRRC